MAGGPDRLGCFFLALNTYLVPLIIIEDLLCARHSVRCGSQQ